MVKARRDLFASAEADCAGGPLGKMCHPRFTFLGTPKDLGPGDSSAGTPRFHLLQRQLPAADFRPPPSPLLNAAKKFKRIDGQPMSKLPYLGPADESAGKGSEREGLWRGQKDIEHSEQSLRVTLLHLCQVEPCGIVGQGDRSGGFSELEDLTAELE